MKDLKDAKFQLKGFLLRNNIQATVNDNWSKKHLRWLTDLILPHHSQQIVLQEMIAYIWAIAREVVISDVDAKTRIARLPA